MIYAPFPAVSPLFQAFVEEFTFHYCKLLYFWN